MKQYFDENGQEYGFDTHDMHLFKDESLTMELSMDSISKEALAKILDGEPIIRCKDCKHYDSGSCRYVYGLIFAKPDSYCSWAERKE